jgi:hypothetical protein
MCRMLCFLSVLNFLLCHESPYCVTFVTRSSVVKCFLQLNFRRYRIGLKKICMYTVYFQFCSTSLNLSLSFLLLPLWSIGHPWNTLFHFSFLILRQSVGLPGRGISPSQGNYLHKHRINADRQPWLEWDSNPWSQCSSGRRQFMP